MRDSLKVRCKVGDTIQPVQPHCVGIGAMMERNPSYGWEVIDIVIGDRHNGDGPTELAVIVHEHEYGSFKGPTRHYIDPGNIRVIGEGRHAEE
jgi:hypothetical protein